jgi:hypothetical protein
MSPVAAEAASADSAPTDGVAVVAGALGVDATDAGPLELVGLDDFEDPQPAAHAARAAEESRMIEGRNIAHIVQEAT